MILTSLNSFIFVFLHVAGGGSIVAEGGTVVGGKCQVSGSLPSETVSLTLRVIT